MKTLLILFLIFASFLKGADTMKTVESVDLEKFMGKWFVIALVPNMIEKGATNSSDTYVLNKDGTIDITYDAIKDGKARQIKQKGTVINKTSNAEWTIQMRKPFIPLMKFPFKIVYVDDNYEYMAVGYPKNTMGWIMGRTPKITDEEYKKIPVVAITASAMKRERQEIEKLCSGGYLGKPLSKTTLLQKIIGE